MYPYTEFRLISLFREVLEAGNIRTCYKYNHTAHSRRYQYEHRILRWCRISLLGHVQYTALHEHNKELQLLFLQSRTHTKQNYTCIIPFNRNPFSPFAGIKCADEKTDRPRISLAHFILCGKCHQKFTFNAILYQNFFVLVGAIPMCFT